MNTSLREERTFAHLFVYFARGNFCPFSLDLAIRVLLLFVFMALLGLFYYICFDNLTKAQISRILFLKIRKIIFEIDVSFHNTDYFGQARSQHVPNAY